MQLTSTYKVAPCNNVGKLTFSLLLCRLFLVSTRELGARAGRGMQGSLHYSSRERSEYSLTSGRYGFLSYLFACLAESLHASVYTCVQYLRSDCAYLDWSGRSTLLSNATRWTNFRTDTARDMSSAGRRGMDGSDVGVERYVSSHLLPFGVITKCIFLFGRLSLRRHRTRL